MYPCSVRLVASLIIKGTFKKFGYETLMVFVNTNLETALARNEKRDRTLPADEVQRMWSQVQNNIGKLSFKHDIFLMPLSK